MMITGIEATVLELIDKTEILTVEEIHRRQHTTQGHGIHQIRRTLKELCRKGLLVQLKKRHNSYLYRLLDMEQEQDRRDFKRSLEMSSAEERELPIKLAIKLNRQKELKSGFPMHLYI